MYKFFEGFILRNEWKQLINIIYVFQDVLTSLRFVYERYGVSGAWQRKSVVWPTYWKFKIEPLDYKETAVFHPNLSSEDNSLIYGITGEVPHYIATSKCVEICRMKITAY